jgi:hypothetical protein
MLKLPRMIHGMSCRHAIILSSLRKEGLRSFYVGPYTLVSMKESPLLLVRTTVIENVNV